METKKGKWGMGNREPGTNDGNREREFRDRERLIKKKRMGNKNRGQRTGNKGVME